MSSESEVRTASKQFYAALNRMANGDASLLADIWLQGADVTALHPIGGRQVGWDAVRASFEQFAQLASGGKIELKDQIVHAAGDVAYEVGVENGHVMLSGKNVTIDHRVTNIYRRQAGGWKMVHHHTDTSPAMLDVL